MTERHNKDASEMTDLTEDLHNLVADYHEDGLTIGEISQALSLVADGYERLNETATMMRDPEVQTALEEDGADAALETALHKKAKEEATQKDDEEN